MKPAQRGMLIGLVIALLDGIVVGARFGVGGAILGGAAGVVAVFAFIPIAIAVLTLLCRLAGVNPREIEERLALLATWGVTAAAAAVTAAAIVTSK